MFSHSPTATNEQNRALPWLITGQIQSLLDMFYPNKKGMKKPNKASYATVPLIQV
jgi:hypothetical protein